MFSILSIFWIHKNSKHLFLDPYQEDHNANPTISIDFLAIWILIRGRCWISIILTQLKKSKSFEINSGNAHSKEIQRCIVINLLGFFVNMPHQWGPVFFWVETNEVLEIAPFTNKLRFELEQLQIFRINKNSKHLLQS